MLMFFVFRAELEEKAELKVMLALPEKLPHIPPAEQHITYLLAPEVREVQQQEQELEEQADWLV